MDIELPPPYDAGDIESDDNDDLAARIRALYYPTIEEELPCYSVANLPIYEELPPAFALISYTVRQANRKLRAIIPLSETTRYPSYLIEGRSGPRFLSRKPDFTLTRVVDTSPTNFEATLNSNGRKEFVEVAHLNTTYKSIFPWIPRAYITQLSDTPRTLTLSAPNFADFHIAWRNKNFVWKMSDHPSTGLVLFEHNERIGDRIVARFSYSSFGMDADKGEEVGNLDIFEIPNTSSEEESEQVSGVEELEWVESVIAGMELVMQHWKSMGKDYRNNITPSRCSIYGIDATIVTDERIPQALGLGAYGF